MPIKVRCPTCEKGVRVADADAGRSALCPACGGKVDVPFPPLLGPAGPIDPDDMDGGFGDESDGGEPVFPAGGVADSDGSTVAAVKARRAERWARGDRGGSNGDGNGDGHHNGNGNGNGHALTQPIGDFYGSETKVRASWADLRWLVYPQADDGTRRVRPLWWVVAGIVVTAAACVAFMVAADRLKLFKSWEDERRPEIVDLKRQAERLATAGRLQEAHDKYLQMDAVIAGRRVGDEDLRKLVNEAHADRRHVYEALLQDRMARARARAQSAAEAQARALQQVWEAMAPPPPARPSQSAGPTTAPAAEPQKAPDAASPPAVAVAPTTSPALPPAPRRRPPLRPVVPTEDVLTDEEIGRSIQLGVDWLLKQFDNNAHVLAAVPGVHRGEGAKYAGMDALAVYALLQCSHALDDPRISIRDDRMKTKIEAMKRLPINGHHETYARAVRSTCLALFNRREDFSTLKADAEFLRNSHDQGAYSYSAVPRSLSDRAQVNPRTAGRPVGTWDNSNSQYGLLGVWSAVEAEPRIEVSSDYWRAVEGHWTRTQLGDGQWGYREGSRDARLTMTSAGIASLFVATEYLEAPIQANVINGKPSEMTPVGREPFSPPLKKAMEWFERGNNSVNVPVGNWWGYGLYGVERVGLASGFKYFGKHDWYRVLAAQIVDAQSKDGSWGDSEYAVVNTSFALLFLSRGRHPILMNKLRFDRRSGPVAGGAPAEPEVGTGFWANRPRDAANLARFTGRVLERPLNWQVVSLENEYQDWMDSPVLYIASHATPRMGPADYDKLRQFVDAGGMIFTHADAASPAFNLWAQQLPSKLSLPYPMTDVPPDHLLHNILFKTSPQPHLKGVSNGSRLLILHSPLDVSHHWQRREDRQFEAVTVKRLAEEKARVLAPFHFGANLFVYAAGKRDLRNRLDSLYVARPKSDPVDVIPVARLEYAGNWDPEPGAWRRYANLFHQQTGTRLEPRAVKLAELKPDPSFYPFAHLTGTAAQKFTPEEVAALRKYVEAGGVVLADACGGGPAFGQSVYQLATQAFPGVIAGPVPAGHPMLNAGPPGMEDVTRPRVRLFNIEYRGVPGADLNLAAAGKGHFLYTSNDLVSGLLGTNTWGIIGFEPKYAQALLKNVIFWTADGQAKPKANPDG